MSNMNIIVEPTSLMITSANGLSAKSTLRETNFFLAHNSHGLKGTSATTSVAPNTTINLFHNNGVKKATFVLPPGGEVIVKKEPTDLVCGSVTISGTGTDPNGGINCIFTPCRMHYLKNMHVIDT